MQSVNLSPQGLNPFVGYKAKNTSVTQINNTHLIEPSNTAINKSNLADTSNTSDDKKQVTLANKLEYFESIHVVKEQNSNYNKQNFAVSQYQTVAMSKESDDMAQLMGIDLFA